MSIKTSAKVIGLDKAFNLVQSIIQDNIKPDKLIKPTADKLAEGVNQGQSAVPVRTGALRGQLYWLRARFSE